MFHVQKIEQEERWSMTAN